jgi:hypothetical protein
MSMSSLRSRPAVAVLLASVCLVVPGVDAGAVVPPRNCGNMTVGTKTYNIKADQLRCRTARTYSRRYLRTRERPRGYRCRNYGRTTKIKFRCSRGIRVFFAIRR